MTAEKLHFDWNSKGNGKLLPARVFDDGSSLYLAWNRETPLAGDPDHVGGPQGRPAQLPDERRIYRRSARSRRTSCFATAANRRSVAVAARSFRSRAAMPSALSVDCRSVPHAAAAARLLAPTPQPAAASAAGSQQTGAVKVANVTSLYTDKLTDSRTMTS